MLVVGKNDPDLPVPLHQFNSLLVSSIGLETKAADRLRLWRVEDDGEGGRLPRDDGFFF